jgi:hypothetical protein
MKTNRSPDQLLSMHFRNSRSLPLLFLLISLLLTPFLEARKPRPKNVDLTQGGKPHDKSIFNVGPTGLRGWAFHLGVDTSESRQILVQEVAEKSPADGIFKVGDVILGVNGRGKQPTKFSSDARKSMAEAITEAEARDPANLNLLRWRAGSTEAVELKLETLGSYSATAPYACPKSEKILGKGLEALYQANDPGTWNLGILVFLAADNPHNPNNDKYQAKAKEWAHNMILEEEEIADLKSDRLRNQGKTAWNHSYYLVTLGEYYLKTRDQLIYPTLEAYAICFAKNQSWFGTTGHKYSDKRPDGGNNGPISGYGAINGSGVAGFYGMVLAERAGVKAPELRSAIRRSENFFASFRDKSGIPYGEHSYGTGGGMYDMNGKNSTAALAFSLLDDRKKEAKFFGRMAMASSADREHSHAGPFFNYVWPALGAAALGKKPASHYLKRTLWLNDLDRRWDGKIVHSHYGHSPKYRNFSAEITTLLTYALPLRQIIMTGRAQDPSLKLSASDYASTVAAEDFKPSKANPDQLIEALKSWSPVVRSKTLKELKKRYERSDDKKVIIPKLHALLKDPTADRIQKASACLAVGMVADDTSSNLLAEKLLDRDSYVRFAAAYGLRYVSTESKMKHLNTILEVTAKTIKPIFPIDDDDPLQFAHHQLAMLLFYDGNAYGPKGVLAKSIKGVDRKLLWPAVRAVAKTPAGQGRSTVGSIYKQLTQDEVVELADAIIESVRLSAPADAMFAKGVRARGVDALEKYGFAEGIALGTAIGDRDSKHAAKVLGKYGAAALDGEMDVLQFLLYKRATRGVDYNATLKAIMNDSKPRKLALLKEIRSITPSSSTLQQPTKALGLTVDGVNHAITQERTLYTWSQVYGPDSVDFSPNATAGSKNTTATFRNRKPGKYQFKVTMTDELGYSSTNEVVEVTYLDRNGKLPASNQPPLAKAITVFAESGVATLIELNGEDPEGEDLAFLIVEQPRHGQIKGTGKHLRYTSNYGYEGDDSFSYRVIDGQGIETLSNVSIRVTKEGVGASVYEPFDYPLGLLDKLPTKGLGLKGKWRAENKKYMMTSGSYAYPALPSKGNKIQSPAWGRSARAICAIREDVLGRDQLLKDGGELWFSFYVGMVGVNRTNGVMSLGLMHQKDSAKASVGVELRRSQLMATINDLSGTSEMPSRGGEMTMPSEKPHLIVGRAQWGKTSEDEDTVEIFRVIDLEKFGPTLLKNPVSIQKGKIDQSLLDSIYFVYSEKFVIDEIRVGVNFKSVLLGTIEQTEE